MVKDYGRVACTVPEGSSTKPFMEVSRFRMGTYEHASIQADTTFSSATVALDIVGITHLRDMLDQVIAEYGEDS